MAAIIDTLTQQEAARLAHVHTRTIRRWVADGHLVGYRMGPRLLRIDKDSLDAMLREIPTARRTA